MMEIIMLKGKSNSGKTAVLHLVHEILVADKAKPTRVEHVGAEDHRDFSDMLRYRRKRIMVFTMGDDEERILEAIREALHVKDCHFLVCACNTGNARVAAT